MKNINLTFLYYKYKEVLQNSIIVCDVLSFEVYINTDSIINEYNLQGWTRLWLKVVEIRSRYVNICVSLIFSSKSRTHNKEQKHIFGMSLSTSYFPVCVLNVAAQFHQILDVNTSKVVNLILRPFHITHSINRFQFLACD